MKRFSYLLSGFTGSLSLWNPLVFDSLVLRNNSKNLVYCEGFILNSSCRTSAAATLDAEEEPDARRPHFITCKMLNASFPCEEALSFPVSVLLFGTLKGKSKALFSCFSSYFLCLCSGKLWSRSVKVAYNLLHKLGNKQEPLVRPGDRVSPALVQLHTWPPGGADVPVCCLTPDAFIFIFSSLSEASFPAQLQTFRLSVCFNASTACFNLFH